MCIFSCKEDPTGPEMNCQLKDRYIQDYHSIDAAKVFDVRTDPPKEIKNGKIEYWLVNHWLLQQNHELWPYPLSEYFIDSIDFIGPASVEIHIFESDSSKVYSYMRDDCGLELTAPGSELHLELTHGGDEVTEQRFVLFDHKSKWDTILGEYVRLDTFTFIEFRLGAFSSYEDIIKQFALDHPGEYDTVGIELVQNKTRE